MKYSETLICKRKALGMTQKEFASIALTDEGMISLIESGAYIQKHIYESIKWNVEQYIRNLDRKTYLHTRIIEETLLLQYEPEAEHAKTLSHLMIHVSKLNMMYVNPYDKGGE